jgi:hypothetical protein
MRRLGLAGAAALIAAIGIAGTASAAGDARADRPGIMQAAWRGGFGGPRFHGGVFIGPSFGFGVYAPLWVPPPAYYAPPPIVVQQGYVAPQVYAEPPAYGPRECSGQWQTVPANPDNAPR